jgi:hypothetical protein
MTPAIPLAIQMVGSIVDLKLALAFTLWIGPFVLANVNRF